MSKNELIQQLQALNEHLKKEGFVIDGLFGSYARGEQSETSDLDLLYHLEEIYFEKYKGFQGFKHLHEVKQMISEKLNMKVDLAPTNNLSKTAQKYILRDAIYV